MHHHKYLSPALVAAGLLSSFARDASAQTPYLTTHSNGTYTPITGGSVYVPVVVSPMSMFDPWDEGFVQIALPFDFTFFDGTYTDIYVHTNGFASFTPFAANGPSILGPPFTIPSTSNAVHNYIGASWDDLTGDPLTSEIRAQTVGASPNRTFVVQVTGLHEFFNPMGSNVDFQIILYEGNARFDVVYGSNAGISGASTGVENSDGTDGFNLMGTYPGCGVGCTCTPSSCGSPNWQPTGKTISVQLPNQPELTPTVNAPPGAYPGTVFSVDIVLRNLGLMPAPNYAYDVYLTTTNTTVTGGTLLGSFNQNGQGASSVVNIARNVTMPPATPPGSVVYVAVVMDTNNTVAEVIETNNTAFSGPIATGPDLTGSVIAPGVTGPGESYDFELTIENRGAPAMSPVSVTFYLSVDSIRDNFDTVLDTQLFTLVGGFDFNGTVTVTIPLNIQPSPPTYYLIADIDDTDQVVESNEANNAAVSINFIDIDGPDLETLTFVAADIAFRGLTYPISMQITNSGGATAHDFTACVVISDNLLISLVTDTTIIETGLLTLEPGESQTLMLQPVIPTNTATGAWYIAGVADCQTVVNEALETNNIKRKDQQITVRDIAPDFTPLEVSSSSAAAAGEQLPVAVRFANLGNADGATHVRLVISENPGVTAMDRTIYDSATATQLAPPGEVTTAVWADIPGDLSSGLYYIGAVVDPDDLVDEIFEDNNTTSVGPVVVVGADLAIVSPPPPPAIIGVAYARRFSAVGGASDYAWELTWAAGAPEGLSFDAALGEISGTPTLAAEGSYGLTVRVTSGNLVAVRTYNLIVTLPTIGLEVVSSRLPPALALEPYQVELIAVGGTPPYHWNVAGGTVPQGVGLSEMGTLGGEPQVVGAFNFEVEVRDLTGALATGLLALDVVDPASSITITTADVPDGEVGTHYETAFAAASGTPGAEFTWRVDGKLPPGLEFDSMTALLSGTPTVAGDYGMVVEVRDQRGLLDRNAYVLTVLEEGALQIINGQSSETGLPNGKVGTPYEDANGEPVRLRAVKPGGDLSTLVWTILEGGVPPGLTFDGATGVILGTPIEAGTYPFIVQVRDATNDVARTSLVIFVEPTEGIIDPGDGGGCGCSAAESERSSAGSLVSFLMSLVVAGLWISRRNKKALLLALVLAAPVTAEAQPVPYQIFETVEPFEPLDPTAVMTTDLSDGNTIAVPLPFEFYLYGQPYSTIWINANGLVGVTDLMFGNHYPPPGVPDQFPPNGWIAGLWADWCAGPTCGFAGLSNAGMGVFYSIDTTPGLGSITIEFRRLYGYNDETAISSATFQIALYEGISSEFSIHFGPMTIGTDFLGQPSQLMPRIGIENALGSDGQWLGPCQATPCDNPTVLGLPDQKITVIADAGEDVTAAGVQVPQVGYPGLPFSSSARIVSRHQNPLGPFRYAVYLIPATSTSTAGGTLVYEGAPINLAGYESRVVTFDVEVPNDQPVGQYRVGVLVDHLDQLSETSEGNNFAFSAQTVRIADRAPDFRVVSARPLQEEVRPGATLEVAYTVQNFGNEPGRLEMLPVLSSNEAITISDLPFATLTGFDTQPRETVTGTLSAQVPAGISTGAYYVGLILDPDFGVPELDETNNIGRSGSTVIIASTEVAIITDALPPATLGQGYSARVRAAGGSGTFTFSLVSGDLPQGTRFDSASGELSGIPLDVGVFPLEIRATSGSANGVRTLDFQVLDPSYPLTIANRTLPDGVLGSDYAVQLMAVGGTPPYTWRLSQGSLTRGILLAPDGAVFGSPSEAGFSAFTVEVRDNMSNTASIALNLNIRSPGNLTIVSADLPDGRIGEPYSQQLSAAGGVAPVTWRAVEDSQAPLPPGLAITGDGVLTGIPEIAKTYQFRVEATDARGTADTNEITLTVLATGRFTIATLELPVGEPNKEYRTVIKAEGGELPYTWEVIRNEGFLPPGFVVEQSEGIAEGESENDLIVRGTLEREGEWAFTARVHDAQGRSDERPFAIVSRVPVVVTEPPEEGCGCSATASNDNGLWGLLLLPLALLLRRRRGVVLAGRVVLLMSCLAIASRAEAQLYVSAQYGAPYVPLTGGTALTMNGNDDDGEEYLSLPFPFSYFGITYNTLDVGVNGAAIFANTCTTDVECGDGAGLCNGNVCEYEVDYTAVMMPSQETPDRILGLMWDDMLFDVDTSITSQVLGTAPNRELVVQWTNISHYDFGIPSVSSANWQLRLDEASGAIRFHYGPFNSAADNFLWGFGVIGIENEDGTQAVAPLPCSNALSCGAPELMALADQVIEFALPVGPELVGSANSATGGDAGSAISIVLTAQNIGTQATGAFQAAFYFSTDDTIIETTDTLLGTRNFSSLAAMSSAMTTLNTTVPNVAPGIYAIGAIIDSNNVVAEVIESNNTILATNAFLVGADLAVAVQPLGPTGPNEVGSAQVSVVNYGSAQPAVGVAVYLSEDTTLNPLSDYLLGTATIAVPAQPSTNITVPTVVPGGIVPGDYWTIAVVDPAGVVIEANENNNLGVSIATSEVTGSDVIGTDADVGGDFVFIGSQIQVSGNLRNDGGATTPPFFYGFYLSDNVLINALTDPLLGEFGPITLAPGQSIHVEHTVDVPLSLAPGLYYMGMIGDSQSAVAEQFETNNISRTMEQLEARAPAPDLTVTSIELPELGAAGESFAVARTLANIGNAAGSADYEVYLSADPFIDPAADVLLGRGGVALDPFAEDVGVDRVRIPSSTANGTYYVGYALDPAGVLDELVEINNLIASTDTIDVLANDLMILTDSLPIVITGVPYQVLFGAAGGAGGFTWSIASGALPAGLTLDAGGLLSGSTTEEGVFDFEVAVSDGSLSASRSFALIVSDKTLPLQIVTRSLVPAFVGNHYRYPLTAFGGIAPYTWTVDGVLPPGITFEGGLLSGTPSAPYVDTLTFRVEDATGAFAERPIALRVVNPDDTVRLSDDVLADGTLGEQYDVMLNVAPGTGTSPFVYTLADGELPAGLILEFDRIYGIPTQVGIFRFALRVSDSRGDFDVNQYVLEIAEASGVSFVTTDLPRGVVDELYAEDGHPVQLRAVSAEASAAGITYRVIGGALPPGLTLEESGTFGGTPTTAGVFPFTVLGEDELGQLEARAFGIWIEADDSALPPPKDEGCGCSAARGEDPDHPVSLAVLLLLGVVLLRRRTLVIAGCLALPAVASAQSGTYLFQTLNEPYLERAGGTQLAFPGTDDDQVTLALPFTFRYFDNDYTSVTAGTNGYVTFSTEGSSRFNEPLPSPATPNDMIALWWDDLYTYSASSIVEGTAPSRVFIIQWDDAESFSDPTGGQIKMQVMLYEGLGGRFEVRYGPITGMSDPLVWAATTGFENDDGTVGYPLLGCGSACTGNDFAAANGMVLRAQQDGGPDIVPTALTLPSVAYPGIPFEVPVRIQSLHMNPLGPFVYQIHLLAAGETTPNRPIYTSQPITLTPYQELTEIALPATALDQASGRYRLALVVDANDDVAEPSEAGNALISAGDFRLASRAPDFAVVSVAPAVNSAAPGQSIAVVVQLANAGNLDGGCGWSLVVSRNRAISTEDLEIHTATIALPLLTTATVTVQVDLPADLAPGAYYFGAVMDPDDAVDEIDEVHNDGLSTAPIIIASDQIAVATVNLPGGYVDVPYDVFLRATGGDGSYRWSLTQGELPAGLSLLPSGEIEGTPTASGDATFTVQVESADLIGQASLTISIGEITGGLSIVTRELLPGIVGDAYPPAETGTPVENQQRIVAVGGSGGTITFVLKSIPPAGLTLESDGYLHGVPLSAGDYELEIEATDGSALVERTLLLTVAEPGRLTLISSVLPDARIGEQYLAELRVVGASTAAMVLFDSPNPLPDGLVLTPAGVVTGEPLKVGAFVFSVRAMDGVGADAPRDTATFQLTVLQDEGFGIGPTSLPDGVLGEAYSAVLEARGGVPPFTWRVIGSELPRGLSYDVSADEREKLELSGVPEEEALTSFMVTLTDSEGRYAELPLALLVEAKPAAVTPRKEEGCGCSAASRPHSSKGGAAGLLLALFGVYGFIRRSRPRRR